MIVVFGSINLDLVFRVATLPRPGETALGPDYHCLPGGKGANQALAAARAGSIVAMGGAVGRDDFARQAMQPLSDAGIDVRRVVPVPTGTGCAAVCVDDRAENQIVVASGANAEASHTCIEDALLDAGTVLVLQNEVPIAQNALLAARARARGARVVWNAAPARPIDRETLAAIDVLVLNQREAAWYAGQLAIAGDSPTDHAVGLCDALGNAVVVTCGASGSVAATATAVWHTPALPVVAVDTTGAGDAYTGVLAGALERGLPYGDALARAAVAAGLACLQVGAQSALPDAAQIDANRHRLGVTRGTARPLTS